MSQSRHHRRSWEPRAAAGALALLCASSCFYTFENPVEKEPPGSVAGVIALQGAVGNQTPAGGQVTVQWTNGLQLTLNSPGKFLFQDLPDGTYALEVYIPPAAGNDFPLALLRPDVVLPESGDTADSLNIGTLQVPASGTVGGVVSPPAAGIVVGAYAPIPSQNIDAGPGTYEGFKTSTDATGHYSFQLPAGIHILAASSPAASALAGATIHAGQSVSADLAMNPVGLEGGITGALVGTGFGASAATPAIPLGDVEYVATANGVKVADGGLFPQNGNGSDTSPGTGSTFTVNLPAGDADELTIIPPPQASTNPCDSFAQFTLPAVPIVAGVFTSLGQVTWLSDSALGANGIGPCADGGVSTDGGQDGGTDGGPALGGWVDAGQIGWDGGDIQQTLLLPLSSSGDYVVSWIADKGAGTGPGDLYSETVQAGVGVQVALTNKTDVSSGSLSGTELGGGVLLSFWTASLGTSCEFVSPGNMPKGTVPGFPATASLGAEQTTTFSGELASVPGAFVLEPIIGDAGIVGFFTADGQTFGSPFGLVPGSPSLPVQVVTLIGTNCNVSDLKGAPGFCVAGSGSVDVDGGPVTVGFVSSFSTNTGLTPTLSSTILTTPPAGSGPVYEGITTLPGAVAVAIGYYGTADIYYWELTDLTVDAGAGTQISADTDLLLNYNGSVLGLSMPTNTRTAGVFLPGNVAQIPPLVGLVNGEQSVVPTAYVDGPTKSVFTAGVPVSYNNTISVVQLLPDGG